MKTKQEPQAPARGRGAGFQPARACGRRRMRAGFPRSVLRFAVCVALLIALAAPVFADSKDENLRPLDNSELGAPAAQNGSAEMPTTSPELEAKYRAELESRLAQERASYEGSLRSLWLANTAVWAVLLGFIIAQAFAARKRAAELERLRQQRESGG
ncbi:MAG: hypothetical protein ICCCNLDF_01871 [Planctomycetes bacterium]|nr:hypothetical protein [Planctomycetota bacterium]